MFDYEVIPPVPSHIQNELRCVFEDADNVARFLYSQTHEFLKEKVQPDRLHGDVPGPDFETLPPAMVPAVVRVAFHLALAYSNPGMGALVRCTGLCALTSLSANELGC